MAAPGNYIATYHARVRFGPDLEVAVSPARFATYRRAAQSDQHAWELYRWNLELSAAALPLAADTEVALRNAVHDRLTVYFGRADWWASSDLALDDETNETLTKVVREHQKRIAKGTAGTGKVVADLMLGTWTLLLSKGGRSALGRQIDYEPIFDGIRPPGTGAGVALIPLVVVWSETVELLRWISPALADFHESNQALPKIFASKPV